MKENKITIKNLIYAILFLVLGIIFITSKDDIIGIVSKVIGIIFIIAGIVKSIVYIYMKGKLGEYKLSELFIGLLVIGLGVLFIVFSGTLSFAIRIIVGVWALLAGINRIILALSIKQFDSTGFKMFLLSAFIMIIVGVLLISGLFDKIIGIFIIIYSMSEIVDYIYYVSKDKKFEKTTVSETTLVKSNKKDKKFMKNKKGKVVDAVIEEEE